MKRALLKGNINVPYKFWDIPGISHITKKTQNTVYRKIVGISLGYPIPQQIEDRYVPNNFWDIPMYQYFLIYVPRGRKVEPG